MYNDARLLDIDGSVRQKQKTKILLFQARRPPKTKKKQIRHTTTRRTTPGRRCSLYTDELLLF